MIAYASNTGTKRNLAALMKHHWRILITPKNPHPPKGFRFAIDNGAWSCYTQKEEFNGFGFLRLIEMHGGAADFIIIPDKVCKGMESLEFSESWMSKLIHFRSLLLPLQNGMSERAVGEFLERYPQTGLFLGGDDEYKDSMMKGWGMVAHSMRRWYHVGRVNTKSRIEACEHCGVDSFDGTSATMYSANAGKIPEWAKQYSLLSPKMVKYV